MMKWVTLDRQGVRTLSVLYHPVFAGTKPLRLEFKNYISCGDLRGFELATELGPNWWKREDYLDRLLQLAAPMLIGCQHR